MTAEGPEWKKSEEEIPKPADSKKETPKKEADPILPPFGELPIVDDKGQYRGFEIRDV